MRLDAAHDPFQGFNGFYGIRIPFSILIGMNVLILISWEAFHISGLGKNA
jgi:hypothetical protein